MRSEPNETSELETECLFGETVKVLDKHLDWFYCELLTDTYIGWVKKKDLGYILPCSHRVISNRTFLFKNVDIKSGYIDYLPLGAQVCVENINQKWAKVNMFEGCVHRYAYVPTHHLIKVNQTIKDWVKIADNLNGTPYLWEGRNSIGLDCSALLQLSYQTYGENIPRNSIDQSSLTKEIIKEKDYLKRGHTVFWKGHVGIMTDEKNCVHANAFHMAVVKEPLVDIVSRTEKDSPIIKILNFN